MTNILLSSAGRRVALLQILRQTLAEMRLKGELIATEMQRASAAYHFADKTEMVERCTAEGFVPQLLDICHKHQVKLLIPTIDTELPILAAHQSEFEAMGTAVNISSPEAIAIANSKDRTHAFLVEQGLPAPRQASVEEVLGKPEAWPFPLFAKPKAGSRSIGARQVESAEDLQLLVGKRDDYIVQSLARGEEYTVDAYVDKAGKCRCAVPRKRLEVRDGEVSKAVTVRNPIIEGCVKSLCERLPGAYGVLCVQVFFDHESEAVNIIEINPRFGGGYPLSWQAGARFPQWLLEEQLGLPLSARWDGWSHGLVMLRYDDAAFVQAEAAGVEAR